MAKDTAHPADIREEFWDRAEDITAGMLSSEGAAPRPMAHTAKPKDNALWFITAKGTDIAEAAAQSKTGQYILACGHSQLYAAINGQLRVETSPEKLDEIWSPMAAVWFDDGRQDDDICLVRFTPTEGEVWATEGSAKALFEFAKAHMTDERLDMGDHGKVTF